MNERASCRVAHGHAQVPAVKHQTKKCSPATSIERDAVATTCQANTSTAQRFPGRPRPWLLPCTPPVHASKVKRIMLKDTCSLYTLPQNYLFSKECFCYWGILDSTRWFARFNFACETLLMNEWGMRRMLQKQVDQKCL